jgi:hypothetical protein
VDAGVSRQDVIAALTQGLSLPLGPIKPKLLGLILEAIRLCWQTLPATKATGDEMTVTALLEPLLNSYFKSDRRLRNLVSVAVRGKETPNFDASRLEMRPDLSVFFKARPENFPLIIECKLIDHPNDKRVGLYCDEGIARFINGDYAWATREAIMLAYVRDGCNVEGRLVPYLTTAAGKSPDAFQTLAHPASDISVHPSAHHSEHGRAFSYPAEVNGGSPGPIRLWHLWLSPT